MGRIAKWLRSLGFIGCLALALLIAGGWSLYSLLAFSKPLEMNCRQYLKERPEGTWVRLSDCQVSRMEAMAETWLGGAAFEVYIPVRSPPKLPDAPIPILLRTRSRKEVRLFNEDRSIEGNEAEQLRRFHENTNAYFSTETVEGHVRSRLDISTHKRNQLEATEERLTPDFIVIDAAKGPDVFQSYALSLLLLGFIFSVVRLVLLLRTFVRSLPSTPMPPPLPSTPPPLPFGK